MAAPAGRRQPCYAQVGYVSESDESRIKGSGQMAATAMFQLHLATYLWAAGLGPGWLGGCLPAGRKGLSGSGGHGRERQAAPSRMLGRDQQACEEEES